MLEKTVIYYSTPAYGHINPALPLISEIVKKGYRVVFYSSAEFSDEAKSCGAEFREYDFGEIRFDPQIGSRILMLSELILKFTLQSAEEMIRQARELCPCLILHDTLALWGRNTAQAINVRGVSINTIVTVNNVISRSFRMYTKRFSGSSIKELHCLPSILRMRNELEKQYKTKDLSVIGILMNKEPLNLYTYPRCMHPDGEKMGEDCLFIGPSAILRKNKFIDNTDISGRDIVYVSLGTIFNGSEKFWAEITDSFADKNYHVVISCGDTFDKLIKKEIPENITVCRYVNQKRILEHSVLFITAGGMNSVCEAISLGVPCLVCPQQGEQAINAKMLEKAGGGKIYRKNENLFSQAEELIKNFKVTPKTLKEFRTIQIKETLTRLGIED